MSTTSRSESVMSTLRDTTGKQHRLEDRNGRWLLLVFHRHLT